MTRRKMNRFHLLSALLFLFALLFCFPVIAKAEESVSGVKDHAGIFSAEELQKLDYFCEEILQEHQVQVVILTENGISGSRKLFLEQYYDANQQKLGDAVLLLLNMDELDRGIEIQGYGNCEYSLSSRRIERLLDELMPYLTEGSYFDAMKKFTSMVNGYVEKGADHRPFVIRTLINLGISVIIAGACVFIMARNSSGRNRVTQSTYLDQGDSRIVDQWDRYIRTTTTKRPKPKQEGGRSSGGGGRSSGGNSHSGGGRSF